MLILYNIGIRCYYFAAIVASIFNNKAKRWLNGRKQQKVIPITGSIWFHFASLGEFEQGRPVLEAAREQHPDKRVVITFFSPSGYEVRKNTPLADFVYYLPLDTAVNAREFINLIKPSAVIFTKYEYWYHYFDQLHQHNIPLYVISAIFRPNQVFFKWYGGLHRKMLTYVTRLFVQDEASKKLLETIGVTNVQVSGDTRFDRVYANALHPKALPEIAAFKNGQPLFIAGSTWPQDEAMVAQLVEMYPGWKFIIAPHEIREDKIDLLLQNLPKDDTIRFSQISRLLSPISSKRILIIDNIGMLSSLYQYGEIAYIGGGFGVGIHNTLEAAAFGLPVIFGPNYERFKEAHDMIDLQAAFSFNYIQQLKPIVKKLVEDVRYRDLASAAAKDYVAKSKGSSELVMKEVRLK